MTRTTCHTLSSKRKDSSAATTLSLDTANDDDQIIKRKKEHVKHHQQQQDASSTTTAAAAATTATACQGKQALLQLLIRAGWGGYSSSQQQQQHVNNNDKNNDNNNNDIQQQTLLLCHQLPYETLVHTLYGTQPMIIGQERCADYRDLLQRDGITIPIPRVAGLQNTGTNALQQTLQYNSESLLLSSSLLSSSSSLSHQQSTSTTTTTTTTTTEPTSVSTWKVPWVQWGKHTPPHPGVFYQADNPCPPQYCPIQTITTTTTTTRRTDTTTDVTAPSTNHHQHTTTNNNSHSTTNNHNNRSNNSSISTSNLNATNDQKNTIPRPQQPQEIRNHLWIASSSPKGKQARAGAVAAGVTRHGDPRIRRRGVHPLLHPLNPPPLQPPSTLTTARSNMTETTTTMTTAAWDDLDSTTRNTTTTPTRTTTSTKTTTTTTPRILDKYVLPIVLVRDPLFWIQSMCTTPYEFITSIRQFPACPQLLFLLDDKDDKSRTWNPPPIPIQQQQQPTE